MAAAKAPERAEYAHLTPEQQEAARILRTLCPPGTTIYTILRHVSRSGMQRQYDLYVMDGGEPRWVTGPAATLLGWRRRNGHVLVNGVGMDMGFHTVYTLSAVLYPDGFDCTTGQHCPSNDHVNEARSVYAEGRRHTSGGDALRQVTL